MTRTTCTKSIGTLALAGVVLSLAARLAVAGEVCVVCTAPAASYRCVIDDVAGATHPAGRLACISAMARDGGHETCAVRSGRPAAVCDGPERRVALPDAGPGPEVAPGNVATESKPVAKPPPETVADLARQVTKSSGEQLKNTGSTIGEAARKTWGCVSSFFKSC